MYIYKSIVLLLKFETSKKKKKKGLSRWKCFKSALSIDGTIIRNKWVKDYTVSPTCNENEIQKPKFLESNPSTLHCWIKCSFIVKFCFIWQNIAIYCCKHECLISSIIALLYQILLLLVLKLKKGIATFYMMFVCSVWL